MNATVKLTTIIACGLILTACGGGGDNSGGSDTGNGGGGTSGGQSAYTVTPSMNSGGAAGGNAISPANPVSVQPGATATFTLTASPGYAVSGVGGTCGGTLNGNTYTTNPVTADCTVAVSFAQVSTGGASIAACFTAPNNVSYALTPVPLSGGYYVKRSVGPGTFNGQAVTAQTSFYDDGSFETGYWTVTSNGVSILGYVSSNGVTWIDPTPRIIPLDMQPGQFVDYLDDSNVSHRMTFIGFENLTLAGKTFTNTCHFQSQPNTPTPGYAPLVDDWFAPGYGEIKEVPDPNQVMQYDGDL